MSRTVIDYPLQLPGIQVWYDLSKLTGLADGQSIASLPDLSGQGHLGLNGTPANQPLFKQGIQNGLPAMLFNGTSSYLVAAALNLSQPLTLWAIAKYVSFTAASNVMVDATPTDVTLYSTSGGNWAFYAGSSAITQGAHDTNWHIHLGVFNGASSVRALDGAEITGNPGSAGITDFYVGGLTGGNWGNVYIAEVGVHSGALSSANRNALRSYSKSKWATP